MGSNYQYLYVVLSLWVVLALGTVKAQVSIRTPYWNYTGAHCLQPNQTQNFSNMPMPPLPQMPKQFQTRVEANIVNRDFSITAEEYFDGPGNRASLWLLQNNTQNALIYDYANNQILYVVNGVCNASNLAYDTNSLLFGGLSGNGVAHVYSTSGALEFAKRNGLAYLGPAVVRGIDVDHWQSCMTWDILFSNFTLDYYFTVPNWTDPVSQPQIPVRATIKGRQFNFNDGTWHDFEHYYDYFDFRNQLWADDSVFETPKGMVCSNRKQTRSVPQLMGQYTYREEIINKASKQESQADVWYDYAYQLVRFDYRPSASVYPFWSTDAASEIHDYVTGIAYAVDRTIGNCTIMPIENATFTAALNKTQTADGRPEFFFKMKNASQLFYLDNTTYTYEGQRKCRDMNCDVFISNRNDFHLDGYGPFNSTFEYYFLANDWTAVNNVGYSTQQSTSVPIRLDITAESWVGYTASYNIYNFDQEHPALSSFDITTCFNPDQRMDFRIDFPDTYDDGTFKYKKVFMEKIILLITQLTKISPIRVQRTTFTMTPDNSFFLGTLLEVPPPTVFYRRIPGVYMQYANDKTLTTDDEYGCASQCNQNTDFVCNSFDYCPSKKTCTLSKTHTEDGQLADSSGQCDHFARTVNNPSLLITLAQAWQILRDIVIHGSFKIPMTLDAGAQKTYTASAISNNVLRSDTRQTSSSSFLDQFRAQINKGIPGYDDLILTGMAIDDCAAACINQEEWICNSFEFHFDSGWCVLSKLHPDEMPNIVQNQPYVDLYIRKYSAWFNQIPGTTVLSSSDAIYQNIFTADECAKLCTDYDGFNCKSFDYCDDISTCFLGKTHYYDVPKSNVQADPMCSHYSMKYLYDFKKYPRKVIQNRDDRIIAGVSVDQCAKLCVDEETFSCASFDYCGNVTECRLSTAAMKGIGQVTLEQQDWCDVYTRQTFPDGTAYVANAQKYYNLPKQDTSKKYTAGAMAGVAIAMLIIGVLLASALLYVYTRYKARAGDDMTIQFSKKEETES